MTKNKTLIIPILEPKVKIDNETKHELFNELQEESQVTIYCSSTAKEIDLRLQICDTTFLFPHESTHKSKLVHSENIARYPSWTHLKKGTTANFVLIFTGLPKSCVCFDLIESISLSGPFIVKNIKRNKTDIYHVDLSNTVL
jgi:hypothetical protein